MQATEILMDEHRVIERVLGALEMAATHLAKGQAAPMEFFLKTTDHVIPQDRHAQVTEAFDHIEHEQPAQASRKISGPRRRVGASCTELGR